MALTALLGALFIANVDVAIANIALPSIRATLRAAGAEQQLVVSACFIAYGALLITAARLGAGFGRRRILLIGTVLFTAASLACGIAPGPIVLIAARLVQGAGTAMMVPQVLASIQLSFDGRARRRALGLYSVALSAGAVAGQVAGGLLVSADLSGLVATVSQLASSVGVAAASISRSPPMPRVCPPPRQMPSP